MNTEGNLVKNFGSEFWTAIETERKLNIIETRQNYLIK